MDWIEDLKFCTDNNLLAVVTTTNLFASGFYYGVTDGCNLCLMLGVQNNNRKKSRFKDKHLELHKTDP